MRIQTEKLIEHRQQDVFRAAFALVRNREDAEDITQDTFIRYHRSDREFESEEHIKAWLLRTAINLSLDLLKSFHRRTSVPFEEWTESVPFSEPGDSPLLQEVLALPEKYRAVIHLYYYEGYTVREIAGILKTSEANIRMRLTRARKILKNRLNEEE